jgi:DUF971 family protein
MPRAVGVGQLAGVDVQHRDLISLRWNNFKTSKFHLLHLRTWCRPCPECQHSTGQRLINRSEIDAETLDTADMHGKMSIARASGDHQH